MSEEQARREKARLLREDIRKRTGTPVLSTDGLEPEQEHPDIQPGDSYNDYVERRMREERAKKRPPKGDA